MRTYGPISGADHFMMVMDQFMRSHGSNGNVCHLVFRMQDSSPFGVDALSESLNNSPAMRHFSQIRLKKFPLPSRVWYVKQEGSRNSLHHKLDYDFNEDWLSTVSFDVMREAGLRFTSFRNGYVVFSWHHSLLDAHGAEIVCKNLSQNSPNISIPVCSNSTPLRSRLSESRAIARHIFRQSEGVHVATNTTLGSGKATGRYLHYITSRKETLGIQELASKLGAELFFSLFVLAGSLRAYREVFDVPQKTPLFIPVPHDRRRRGSQGLFVGNQLTFLYFRDEFQSTLKETYSNLVDQMQEAIAKGFHSSNTHFMNLARNLPVALYKRMLLKPGKGQLGTFFFSDIGSGCDGITSLGGNRIQETIHYPPNVAPPGFTLITGRKNGDIFFTIVFDTRCIQETRAREFLSSWLSKLTHPTS